MRATQQDVFFGPPIGRRVEMSGIQIDRFEGDKMVEEWPEYHVLGALRQIAVYPEPQEQAGS
jgi:predicted ester cyclase